ncbi:MAG: lysophospholipid acyltransferase family protein [Deltaproteobacteria bacterium]|nr:lysophospholipid acyltransferase family protein [Deltaproteobacteria bacterium]
MRVDEGILRDILRLLIWFPFRWLTGVIPVRSSLCIFKVMGDLHFYLGRDRKKQIAENLMRLLNIDDKTAFGIGKRIFEVHYIDRLHIFLYTKLAKKKTIERYVYFENLEVFENELKKGRGVLLVQPHFGPVQITLLSLALMGYKPYQIGYPTDKGLSRVGRDVAYKYRLKYEAMIPAPIYPADGFLGAVYKYLTKGGVVLTTGDGAGGGVFLGEHRNFDFLGSERMFPLGPAALAIKTGAAYIPTFIIPERHDRFRIVFESPVQRLWNDIEKDKDYMTGRFVSVAAEYIRRYPYCWHFWDEKR